MAKAEQDAVILQVGGREVRITNPQKSYFSREIELSKLDIVNYYLAVADGALRGIADRPLVLKRFVDGAEGEAFYQKRAPSSRPAWLQTVTLTFPSGRSAEEVVINDAAGLLWAVNLGCLELHPHPIRSTDLEHPDELRIDLDPGPGVPWQAVTAVALEVRALLSEVGLVGYAKTSGSRGMHVSVRIAQRWSFSQVRLAALAFAREIERRVPTLATSKWWKEERHGVFLDYNQNAKDRTTCSAFSVRPLPDARVSMPLDWNEVANCNPAEFTVLTAPSIFLSKPDPFGTMESNVGNLEPLLEMAARDEKLGLKDAPWPPHFRKHASESPRVAPSRAKKAPGATRSKMPLITVARSFSKDQALLGLERWKAKHSSFAPLLQAEDILVDAMRGRSSTYTRIRVNLRNVPQHLRPPQETPDPDDVPSPRKR